ncbi:MAG: TetR/AcrR family transcriptional regulator [Clostridia bacterium]|nr:TetR/AcrR family transcriptional regulator [Clostridia bacterium]
MKKTTKQDIRVVKTRAAVRRAFLSLACEKAVTDISIKEIADEAKINRTTFYLHYKSVEDIYHDIINEHMAFCEAIIKKHNNELLDFNFAECAVEFAEYHDGVFVNAEKLRNSVFMLCMRRKVRDIFRDFIAELYAKPEMKAKFIPLSEAILSGIAAGVVSVISNWISSDRRTSLRDSCNEWSFAILNGIKKI